jgi:hypothetical protein
MPVGRRHVVLALAFLSLSVLTSTARAQQGHAHEIWTPTLTPEQLKAALAKLAIDGSTDPLEKLLRDHLQKERPDIDPRLRDFAIKQALSDPKFMERAKQFAKEKQTEPGRTPKFSQEDLAKLREMMPKETDPKKLPPGVKLPPDWKSPPEGSINTDPKRPGKFPTDPKTPLDPKTQPTEPVKPPETPPMGDPMGPMNPPGTNPGAPAPPKSAEDSLFRPPEEPSDPRSKSLQAFASIWERNVGPLDETPEVKRALFDLVSGTNGLDLDIQDSQGNSIWDLLKNGDGSGLNFGDFAEGGNWKLPQFDMPSFKLGNWGGGSSSSGGGSSGSWNWGSSSSRPRPGSSGGGSGGFGSFGFGGSWFPVIILGIIVLGILIWVLVKNLRTPATQPVTYTGGLGPWPIDPRAINTREDVVKAFEYLSVLICGPAAKTWTHNTIADALSELAVSHGETAVMLARLYELARYAPLDEPMTREELLEARELVCGLAGVSY